MLMLTLAMVELPFFATFLAVQILSTCSHCRNEWRTWPILPGLVPCFVGTFGLGLLPRSLSMLELRVIFALLTAGLIFVLFVVVRRNKFWKPILAGSLILSTAEAVVTWLLLAA